MTVWNSWVESQQEGIAAAGRWRTLRALDGAGPEFMLGSRQVVSFASNDYLGLSSHPSVVDAAGQALERWGAGAGSSRLIVGDRLEHRLLEEELAVWRDSEAALVFPTGYQANVGVMTTFAAGARIVSDELNHASIIDGCRLAQADVRIFRHKDYDHAAELLTAGGHPPDDRTVLVSDTVFSMDGDLADVGVLSEICSRTGALLVLDDAHRVFDQPELAVPAGVPLDCLRVGTLSKALGSQGGFVCGPRRWMELMVNRARSFIFSTGLAPVSAAAARAAIAVIQGDSGGQLISRLRDHVDAVRPGHPSPIIPVVLGDEAAAVAASERLLEEGFLVPAIRPPTVPPGTSRLRVSLCSTHRSDDVEKLVKALAQL